ncbi:MAG: glycosyltransferase family A protein [Ignavibacteria bacterium]|jgi:glycosyltransferase involved in cell wall biosynthesis
MKYIIVTPCKNEDKYIVECIKSIIGQKILPEKWIIVNDNSTDKTKEIILSYSNLYSWIELVNYNMCSDERKYGAHIQKVFYYGLNRVSQLNYDFFSLIDADIKLPENYFEEVIKCFERYPKVGSCGGKLYNLINGKLEFEDSGQSHIRGAFKTYRKICFEQLKGFKNVWSWDGLDDMETLFNGWEIKVLDLKIIHLKPTGTDYNLKNERIMAGKEAYKTRYGFDWIIMKSIQYLFKKPYFWGSFFYLHGYFIALLKKETKIVDTELGKFIRNFKRKEILDRVLKYVNN